MFILVSLVFIGFLLIVFAIFYLIYHFIRKVKNRHKRISKFLFLIPLIVGIILFSIGISFIDTGDTQKLNESLEANTNLKAEVKQLSTSLTKLESTSKELTAKNKELIDENNQLSTKVEDGLSNEKDLNEQIESLEKDKKKLEEKVANLEKEIKTLKNNISDLQSDLEGTDSSAAANTGQSSSEEQTTATTASSSSESEYFANCTELRAVYPSGVPSTHSAYQPKMDRDKDNYACER